MTPTTNRYRSHIEALAQAFKIHIIYIDPVLRDYGAGSGPRVIACPQCSTVNRLPRRGILRCGKCKHPLGTHEVVDVILIAPVHDGDDITYSTALHELGHCITPLGRVCNFEGSRTMRHEHKVATLRDMRLQLTQEEAAWDWAKAHALCWTEAMEHDRMTSLETYRAHARRIGALGRR